MRSANAWKFLKGIRSQCPGNWHLLYFKFCFFCYGNHWYIALYSRFIPPEEGFKLILLNLEIDFVKNRGNREEVCCSVLLWSEFSYHMAWSFASIKSLMQLIWGNGYNRNSVARWFLIWVIVFYIRLPKCNEHEAVSDVLINFLS